MQVDKIVHPALIPFMAITSLVGIGLGTLGLIFLEGAGTWITVLLGALFLMGGQVAFWANFFHNRAVWKKFEARYGQMYWFDLCDTPAVKKFIFRLSSLEENTRELLGEYGEKKISEPLYCFVMKQGEVTWHDKKAKGLQRDNWIKIEWRGKEISFKLARHELMHYFLSRDLPRSSTEEQHEIMKQCIK